MSNKQIVREALNACVDASWHERPVPTGKCGAALTALDALIDPSEFIEKLEKMKMDRKPDESGYTLNDRVIHNLAIDEAIKLAKGE